VSGRLRPLFGWRSALCDSDLPPTTRHVALTLSLHMNERGGSAFPAIATLARETGLSESTVREHLHQLRDTGWLSAGERGRPGLYHGTADHSAEAKGGRHRTIFYTAAVPPTFRGTDENPPAAGAFSEPDERETHRLTDINPPAPGGDLYKNSEDRSAARDSRFDQAVEIRVAARMAGRQIAERARREYARVTRESVRADEGDELARLCDQFPTWTAAQIAAKVAETAEHRPEPAPRPVAYDPTASTIRALELAGMTDEADELRAQSPRRLGNLAVATGERA